MSPCTICKTVKSKISYQKGGYQYYFCKKCQTLFLHPTPLEKKLKDYYKKDFRYSAGEANEKLIRQRAKIILKNLKKLNPNGKSLLDIGSGYGFFLEETKKIDIQPFGLEPSRSIYNISIKHLIEIEVMNVNFDAFYAQNKNMKFDFITLIHTVEHLVNPQTTITIASKMLNSNGILYIETPNLDSHLFRVEKQNYTFLTPPDHLWIFSKCSFHRMLKSIPELDIIKISSYSAPEHLMGIIKTILDNRNSVLATNKKNGDKTHSKNKIQKNKYLLSSIKYLVFDRLIAPIFTPLLNLGIYGSILELYIRKK